MCHITVVLDDDDDRPITKKPSEGTAKRPPDATPLFSHPPDGLTSKITSSIDALVDALREESPEQMTTFRLFVNCEEWVIETSERTSAQLKAAGISMRNLRGNFIRENNPAHPPTVGCGEGSNDTKP